MHRYYGEVDIGNGPAPVLLFRKARGGCAAVYVPRSPIYMYDATPGHAEHWSKLLRALCGLRPAVVLREEPPTAPGSRFHGYRDHHDGRDH